jgi:hypothetical protein
MSVKTKVNVYDCKFQDNYGHKPRGFGLWAFELIDASCDTAYKVIFAPRSMTFAEARKWIVSHVKAEYATELATGYVYVEVAR